MVLKSATSRGVSVHWPELKDTHIFVKELRAAVNAIKANAPTNGTLVLAIDNTAAAHVLRSFYSSTSIGQSLAQEAYEHLRSKGCRLVVAGLPGLDNYADAPTKNEEWCSERLKKTWTALEAALEGRERHDITSTRRSSSHEDDEADQLMEELKALRASTMLEG